MNKKLVYLGGVVMVFIMTCVAILSIQPLSSSKACSLPDIDSYHGEVIDLLVLSGNCVVPTAIEAIKDQSLSKRSFIIGFLGHGGYWEALEPLTGIVGDESDPDRDVAIIAVFRINPERGRELADRFKTEKGDLGKNSRDILLDKEYLYNRTTYWVALRRYISVKHGL
jgi:hypothetical protein